MNAQRFQLRCRQCDIVVRFGDGSACEHVPHGIVVEWFDEPANGQASLFPERAA